MKISFIIPSYNASSYIQNCLDSIYDLKMQETDFEVVVIDDCSTDNTAEIVRRYSDNHSNMVQLQQPGNRRQGAARNRGIAVAKGEYIAFVDSDDMTGEGVLSALEIALRLNLDMAVMNYEKISLNGKATKGKPLNFADNEIFTGVEMHTKHPFWVAGPCSYLYKASFLRQVGYPFAEDVLYEDTDFVSVHLYYAKRMAYCKECGYVIYENMSSVTHRITYKNVADYFFLGTRMLRFHSSIDDKTTDYARSILEGGSFNISFAFKILNKLSSRNEIAAAFKRIDEHYDRKRLLSYREPKYCWTPWTRLCLKHKGISILVACLQMVGRKLLKRK